MTPNAPAAPTISPLSFLPASRAMLLTLQETRPVWEVAFGECDDGDQFATLIDVEGRGAFGVFPVASGTLRITYETGQDLADFTGLETLRDALLGYMDGHEAEHGRDVRTR